MEFSGNGEVVASMNDIIVPRHVVVIAVRCWEDCASTKRNHSNTPAECEVVELLISGRIQLSNCNLARRRWTGPISLQPERRLSGDSDTSKTTTLYHSGGVKVY
jgi:hypothetical protein